SPCATNASILVRSSGGIAPVGVRSGVGWAGLPRPGAGLPPDPEGTLAEGWDAGPGARVPLVHQRIAPVARTRNTTAAIQIAAFERGGAGRGAADGRGAGSARCS